MSVDANASLLWVLRERTADSQCLNLSVPKLQLKKSDSTAAQGNNSLLISLFLNDILVGPLSVRACIKC